MSVKRTHDSPVKIAFVSVNNEINAIISSYIETIHEEMISARIFETEDQARAWVAEA